MQGSMVLIFLLISLSKSGSLDVTVKNFEKRLPFVILRCRDSKFVFRLFILHKG